MKIKCQSKVIFGAFLLLNARMGLSANGSGYPPARLPEMQMHIFTGDQAAEATPASGAPQVEQIQPLSSGEPELHMVVFDAGEAAASKTPPPPSGENLKLTYKDDNQVEVQEEVMPDNKSSMSVEGFDFLYEVGTGYQQDRLNWNVASPTGSPNPSTEVQWDNVQRWRIHGLFDIYTPMGFAFKGRAGYAWTFNGSAQETSFLHDDRAAPFSRIDSDADDGSAWDASLGAGYRLKLGDPDKNSVWGSLTPLAGYSYEEQKFKMKGGRQQVPNSGFDSDQLRNIDNTYVADWYGPWLGLDANLSLFDHHKLFSSFEYHWPTYRGKATWKPAPHLEKPRSFTHDADGTGYMASVGYRFQSSDLWGISLSADYLNMETDSGRENLFLSNGQVVESTLNEVNRESFGVNLGVNIAF